MGHFLHRLARNLREAFPTETDRLERIAFGFLLLFVVFAPLPQGGILPAGRLFIELSAFLITAATFASRTRTRGPVAPKIPLLAMLSIAVLGAIQLLPLPAGMLASVSPASAKIYHETAEILSVFGQKPDVFARISIAPRATADVILLVLADVALFLSALQILTNRARRRLFVAALLGGAVLHVVIAATLQIGTARLHGAFLNPDHFGASLEIALAIAFGALWAEVLLNADRARGTTDRAERLESRFLPIAGPILVWSIIAIGIGLTQSRGSIAAASLTTVCLLVAGASHPRIRAHRRRAWRGILAVASGIGIVALVAGGIPLLRFVASDARDLHGGTRLSYWTTSLAAWKEFPYFGSGLGSFPEAFRLVQPRSIDWLVEYAHSDPLQLLVTGGLLGGLLGTAVYGSLFVLLFRAWRTQKHREESALVLAGLGALLSLTLHGLVEYDMSIPAIPATLACALGLAMAAGAEPGRRVESRDARV